MSNHAYKSATTLRSSPSGPIPIGTLRKRFSLAPVSAEDAMALNNLNILGVSVDSAGTVPGELFMELPGFAIHGARFVAGAVASGTVAVLIDADGVQIVHQAAPSTPVLVHSDPCIVASPLNAEAHHHPARDLIIAAVTGINGKTTTIYFLDVILSVHVGGCMVAGTVELRAGEHSVESPHTIVEAPILQRMMVLTVGDRVGAAPLEASSHAIVLYRLDGIVVDVAGFANLQRDHLDFHKAMEGYSKAKAQLFTFEHARHGVVYVDGQWGAALVAEAPIGIDRVRAYPGETSADWWVGDAVVSLIDSATTSTLHKPDGEEIEVSRPLPGLVSVQNVTLALVMAICTGVPAATAVMALAGAYNIPNHIQRINQRDGRRGLRIVDFAHIPDAMELALKAMRPITPGCLVVVLGSDGDRDQGKRPILGKACTRLANILTVTDENPRNEDPQLIRNAILEGVRGIRLDLTDAKEITTWCGSTMRRGVELCGPDDTVIVTGKDHGPSLEMIGELIRYNDMPVVTEAVKKKQGWA